MHLENFIEKKASATCWDIVHSARHAGRQHRVDGMRSRGWMYIFLNLKFRPKARRKKDEKRRNVSILVLMDLSFLQPAKEVKEVKEVKFQSLFLWIFRSYNGS